VAMGDAQSARKVFAERNTRYVALCPDLREADVYVQANPEGFMGQLRDGEAPEWLQPVAIGEGGNLRLWKVRL